MRDREKLAWCVIITAAAAFLVACASGCSTADRAYKREVTWRKAAVVQVSTNEIVVTNAVPVVTERTNIVLVTNGVSGAVTAYAVREPVGTNIVAVMVTNLVPVFATNLVQVPVTNLVARPEAEETIRAAGAVINVVAPGVGSIVALVLGGLYHGYRQLRNRKVNEALVQGVETARAVLASTPQGVAADAQLVKWLMGHQKEAGVFATVTGLVDQFTDNPAARVTAMEITERVRGATKRSSVAQPAA
jgi:hypothetical protein